MMQPNTKLVLPVKGWKAIDLYAPNTLHARTHFSSNSSYWYLTLTIVTIHFQEDEILNLK